MMPPEKINEYILNLAERKISLFFLTNLKNRNLDSWELLVPRSHRHRRFWPAVFVHDQEPLDFDSYLDDRNQETEILIRKKKSFLKNLNLRWHVWPNIHSRAIITHSEINSNEVEKYKNNYFEPVYYWSHAIIARDWFRYAEHDPVFSNFDLDRQTWDDFLIYSRGWQGSREYRLFMADLMIDYNLVKSSNYSILHVEDGEDLEFYSIHDKKYQGIDLPRIKNTIKCCRVDADSSARYDPDDFLNSAISVVLETQFSDRRIHLTEKTLRAIALAHPFILAAAPGALEYLRSYGFKTYAPYIDESYDLEIDPATRLKMICQEMARIRDLPADSKKNLYRHLRARALKNREWFFSREFEKKIIDELDCNFLKALERVKTTDLGKWLFEHASLRRKSEKSDPAVKLFYEDPAIKSEQKRSYKSLILTLRSYRTRLRNSI